MFWERFSFTLEIVEITYTSVILVSGIIGTIDDGHIITIWSPVDKNGNGNKGFKNEILSPGANIFRGISSENDNWTGICGAPKTLNPILAVIESINKVSEPVFTK